MANAIFVKTKSVDTTSNVHSVGIVDVDGSEVEVNFWYSIIDKWGKYDTKTYLCAEALKQTGNLQDAHILLQPSATGTLTKDDNGGWVDTRNWQQNWIDSYPIVGVSVIPEVDPLADAN